MTERAFVDSNVLVYSDDVAAPGKRALAVELLSRQLEGGTGVVSTQVFAEYFSITTGKLKTPVALARQKIELLSLLDVVRPATDDILAAIDLHRLHGLSFWDALIVRAAQLGRCRVLYTEDLQHGRRFDGGVQVVNPFAAT
jgi:predicted nucleic acid-binding protein